MPQGNMFNQKGLNKYIEEMYEHCTYIVLYIPEEMAIYKNQSFLA